MQLPERRPVERETATATPLVRPRLRDALDRMLAAHRLVWLGAKAGSGKTTVAAEWQAANREPAVWLQIDVADADPGRFFVRLGRALAEAGHVAPAQRPLTREHLASPAEYARLWFGDLAAGTDSSLIVVLDDAHLAGEALERWLRQAIDTPELALRWLVLSRDALPAGLQRAALAGHAAALGDDELALTVDECRALLHRRGIDDAHAQDLVRHTEGWPAAVAATLAAWARAGARPAVPAIAVPEALMRYVDAEILRGLDAAASDVLISCCALPFVRDGWAVRLSGRDDAAAVFDRLAQRQLLVRRQADGSYVMHALLRAALESQAATRLGHAQRREWVALSAQLLADDGNVEAALELCIQAQDWQCADRRLGELAPAAMSAARHASVARWAGAIPVDARSAWTRFWLGQAGVLASPAQGRAQLIAALDAFADDERTPRLHALASIMATYFQEYSAAEPLAHWLARLREVAPDFDAIDDPELRAVVTVAAFSGVFMRDPTHADLPQWIERVERLFEQPVDPNVRIRGAMLLAKHYWYTGQYERLRPLAARVAPPLSDARVLPYSRLVWQLFLQYDAWAHGDMARGLAAMDEGLALAENNGIHLLDNHLMIHGACFALALGRRDDAFDLLVRSGRNRTSDRPMEQWHHAVSMSWWHASGGDLASAEAEAQVAITAGSRMGPSPRSLALVAAAYAQRARREVIEATLAALETQAAQTPNRFGQWHLHLLRGEYDAAAAIGEKHQLICVLHADRVKLADFAGAALRAPQSAQYAARLIAAWRLSPPAAMSLDGDWPWPVRIRTLGRFAVDAASAETAAPRKSPTRQHAVLQALIGLGNANGSPVPISALADAVWSDADGDKALHACEMVLHRLRAWLGDDAVIVRDQSVALASRVCWVDAWELSHRLDRIDRILALGQTVERDDIERAVALYRGEFLSGIDAPWAVRRREALLRRFVQALTQAAAQDRDERISADVRALLANLAQPVAQRAEQRPSAH